MSKDTKQFLFFLIGALAPAAVGGLLLDTPWGQHHGWLIGALWLLITLTAIGMVVDGVQGAIVLVFGTLTNYLLFAAVGAVIALLAAAIVG